MAMKRKRALFCSYYPPEFDRDGGSRRILDLIEMMRADDWTISFVASHRMDEARYVRELQQRGVAVFDGKKIQIEDLLVAAPVDLAMFAFWPVAEIYLPIVRRVSPRTRIIVDSVDLHFLRNARGLFLQSLNKGATGALDANYGNELVRELNVYAAADAVLTVSQKEADLLRDFTADPNLAQAVPQKEDLTMSPYAQSERRGILFVGSFRHAPNIAAVEFLCKEVVPCLDPALLACHPVYIVGEKLDDTVRQFGEGLAQVRMVGWVPSVMPYLERTAVSVVPLLYGAGTKTKLLQAMAAGLPVVSTTVGVEGLSVRHGEDVLIADDARSFAQCITEVLDDPLLWQRLSEQSQSNILGTHGHAVVESRLKRVVQRIFESPPKRACPQAPTTDLAHPDAQQYEQLRREIHDVVSASLPSDAKIIVVSRGDDELLKLNGCTAWHFPQNADGLYAGHHPVDSMDAIARLEALRSRGGEYLMLPSTAFWWLDYYREFRQHLENRYVERCRRDGVCVIYHLSSPSRDELSESRQIAHHSDDETPEVSMGGAEAEAVRLIAFYLPQFHPISENDAWWGPGFTEWRNVVKAQPLFPGHLQPQLPADLGYYDLRASETREAQADLARQYGIHGFCYYHYWFTGKRLLERPFNEVVESGKPDFPFCLCWANEPWSRNWDGRPHDVLQPQKYNAEDDAAHIQWLLPALSDRRAIQIAGRPVFLVYQGKELPTPEATIETWRRAVERAGLPGIYLIAVETGWDAGWDATQAGFDAKVLFQPQFSILRTTERTEIEGKPKLQVFDYQKAWPVLANPEPVAYRRFDTVFPAWDNTARKGEAGWVVHNSTPDAYNQWLKLAITRAQNLPQGERVVFLNAWNEWAEGAHLEPDTKHHHAYLEATHQAVRESLASSGNGAKIGRLDRKQLIPRT